MYYAYPIGLDSLIYDATFVNIVPMTLDLRSHMGRWEFTVKKCVDRRNEPYGALDCPQNSYNKFVLEFQLVDSCTWGAKTPETQYKKIEITVAGQTDELNLDYVFDQFTYSSCTDILGEQLNFPNLVYQFYALELI